MFQNLFYYKIKDSKIEELSKNVGYLGEKSSIEDITSFFADVAMSLNDLKIVSALTGGYDSRMVVASLNFLSFCMAAYIFFLCHNGWYTTRTIRSDKFF